MHHCPCRSLPRIKWRKSMAKELFYERILDGSIPLHPEDGSMKMEETYFVEGEFQKHSFEEFEKRLEALRQNALKKHQQSFR
jgi:hypothetical protein